MLKKSLYSLISCLMLFLLLSACGDKGDRTGKEKLSPDQLIEINKELAIKERERIESYILRKELLVQQSNQGFWYAELKEGDKKFLKANSRIQLEYTCSMLDGTMCYSSDKDGLLTITIGKSDIPSGLDSALRLFSDGSEAIVILPSSLAYGLIGDGKRIPARAALIYHFKVFGL